MKNINKEKIILEFVSNKSLLNEILSENKGVFDYITREKKVNKLSIELLKDVISDFINETFYCLENIKTKKKLLKIVKDYSLTEYVESKIDKSPEVLFESYKYFQKYIDSIEWPYDYDMFWVINEAQYSWYYDFYKKIKNSFVKFLSEKGKK